MSECTNKKYTLRHQYQDVELNHREALCMHYLYKNFNIPTIAIEMKLSTRTVRFYTDTLILKLKCKNLDGLRECISGTELLQYFEKND